MKRLSGYPAKMEKSRFLFELLVLHGDTTPAGTHHPDRAWFRQDLGEFGE
jgi:hypothetical protein